MLSGGGLQIGVVALRMAPHLPFMVGNLSELASVIVDIDGRSLRVTTLSSEGETLDSYRLLKD